MLLCLWGGVPGLEYPLCAVGAAVLCFGTVGVCVVQPTRGSLCHAILQELHNAALYNAALYNEAL